MLSLVIDLYKIKWEFIVVVFLSQISFYINSETSNLTLFYLGALD